VGAWIGEHGLERVDVAVDVIEGEDVHFRRCYSGCSTATR
jgi:hypothetical protein